jgi:predicted dehydrogenase
MQRRDFIPVAAASLSLGARRILGANDRVAVAIVGLGERGSEHLAEYLKMTGVEVAAICDVDPAALEKAQSRIVAAGARPARQFSDMRRVFEQVQINAISMATPNHWHALGAVWAMHAGKDVYCEKPASHDPNESRIMLDTARKTGRMLQVGTQSRSMPHKMEAVELLRSGIIGKVYAAKGVCYKRRKSIGHKPDSAAPKGVDWDAFLGPAPMRPFNELRFKYNWHWFWDTGNGDLGNQGVHQMDVARWGLGLPDHHGTLHSVSAAGGKLVYVDDQETPNTVNAIFEFDEDKWITFEVRGLVAERVGGIGSARGNCIGNVFYGADGFLELDDSFYRVYQNDDHRLVKEGRAPNTSENTPHIQNFLDAVRSRDYKSLRADIAIGAASADLCHFANISYRTGRKLTWDAPRNQWKGDGPANQLMSRQNRAPYVWPASV